MFIKTDTDQLLVFRTCEKEVYDFVMNTGSLWLRTSHYYQNIEDDIAREDKLEGLSTSKISLPLTFESSRSNITSIEGEGFIGETPEKAYIISFHGISIEQKTKRGFGPKTFGIYNIEKFINNILNEAKKQFDIKSYIFGKVIYQYSPVFISSSNLGGSYKLNEKEHLSIYDQNLLRKRPIEPFILQDEFRFVLFVDEYIDNNIDSILKINVSNKNFYDYSENHFYIQ